MGNLNTLETMEEIEKVIKKSNFSTKAPNPDGLKGKLLQVFE